MKRSILLLSVLLSGCGGSDDFESKPVDVSGSYTMTVTSKANDCGLANWKEGESAGGIPVTVTQDGKSVNGSIDGLVGGLVKLWLGSNTFQGTVDGEEVHATNFGTNSTTSGGCSYTLNMVLDGVLDGNALQGTLTYEPQTNGSPDCGQLETCQNVQDFVGSRPPN